jgi:hypothetical protein
MPNLILGCIADEDDILKSILKNLFLWCVVLSVCYIVKVKNAAHVCVLPRTQRTEKEIKTKKKQRKKEKVVNTPVSIRKILGTNLGSKSGYS